MTSRPFLPSVVLICLGLFPAVLAGQSAKIPTETLIWSDPNNALIYQPITLFAEVIGDGTLAPAGTVSFRNAGALMGVAQLHAVTNTNYLRYSSQFDEPVWKLTSSDGVVTASYSPNPLDGRKTAFRYQNTAAHQGNALCQDVAGLPEGQRVTFSVWIKGNGSRDQDVGIAIIDNLHHKAIETPCYLTSDWQRCWVTTYEATDDVTVQVGRTDTWWPWDASIWGAQLEAAAAMGPYITSGDGPATSTIGLATFTTSFPDSNNNVVAAYGEEETPCPCLADPPLGMHWGVFSPTCEECPLVVPPLTMDPLQGIFLFPMNRAQ